MCNFPGSESANHCSWSQFHVIWGEHGHGRSVSLCQAGSCWELCSPEWCAEVRVSFCGLALRGQESCSWPIYKLGLNRNKWPSGHWTSNRRQGAFNNSSTCLNTSVNVDFNCLRPHLLGRPWGLAHLLRLSRELRPMLWCLWKLYKSTLSTKCNLQMTNGMCVSKQNRSTAKKHSRRFSSCMKGKNCGREWIWWTTSRPFFWEMAWNGMQQHFLIFPEQRKGFQLTALALCVVAWLCTELPII